MKLDLVHDIQGGYRKVLSSMSTPGEIESIKTEAEKVDLPINCFKESLLLMLMLLDGEVSFNIVSQKSMEITSYISQLTYAKVKPIEEADFIFVLEDLREDKLGEVIKICKIGDLVNPHKSSTIIVEFDDLTKGEDLKLMGPGIKDSNRIKIQGDMKWLQDRSKKNSEYPLGVELIFTDKLGNLISIPRTTSIEREGN